MQKIHLLDILTPKKASCNEYAKTAKIKKERLRIDYRKNNAKRKA